MPACRGLTPGTFMQVQAQWRQRWTFGSTKIHGTPADTRRKSNVIMTSKRCRDVVFDVIMTLSLRRVPVGAPLQGLTINAVININYFVIFRIKALNCASHSFLFILISLTYQSYWSCYDFRPVFILSIFRTTQLLNDFQICLICRNRVD